MEGLGGATRPFGIMLLNYSNSGNNDFHHGYSDAPPHAGCHYSLPVTADRNRWRARAVVTCAVAIVVGVAVAGCGDSGGAATTPAASPRPSASPPGAGTPSGTPSGTATSHGPSAITATPAAPDALASCVNKVYGRLTEEQRVGQLFLVGLPVDVAGPATTAALQAYHFGSLLLAPSSAGVAALAGATAHMQSFATSSVTGGAGFYIAANQEGGQVQHLTGPGFSPMPSALSLPPAATKSKCAARGR